MSARRSPVKPAPAVRRFPVQRIVFLLLGLLVIFAIGLVVTSGFWANWLWFGSLGLQQVLVTRYVARWSLFLGGGLLAALFFGVNLRYAARQVAGTRVLIQGQEVLLAPRLLSLAVLACSLVVGFLLGSAAGSQWSAVLAYLNKSSFGVAEPIYNRDVAFYVFTMPLLEAARSWLLGLLILTIIAVAALAALRYSQGLAQRRFELPATMRGHLSLLGALALACLSFSYWLANYDLLFSTRGVVFGASKTDLAAQRPANYLLLGLSLLAALLLAWNAFARRLRPLISVVVVWGLASVLVGVVYPAAYQSFAVRPSELRQETPYIEHNIAMTRKAY